MIRVCLFLSPALLALGCGRVDFERPQVSDGSVDSPIGSSTDGSIDGPIDAAPAIKTVRVDTPATVNAQRISSSPLPLSAGNVVIAIPYWNDRTHRIAVTDSTALTWKSIDRQSVAQGCAAGTNLQIFYATIPSSGTVTVTATQPEGAGNMGLFVIEYSGLAEDPLDGSIGTPAPRESNLMTTGALTTTSFDVLVAAYHDSNGGGRMIPDAGFMVLATDTTSYAMTADRQVPPGSYEPTARLPGTTSDACWVASVIALRAR
jgi:hypothetical protein